MPSNKGLSNNTSDKGSGSSNKPYPQKPSNSYFTYTNNKKKV